MSQTFKGGVHPDDHKSLTHQKPIEQLPLPQQHQMMISRMIIQQQLPPPKPLLHIPEPPMKS